MNRRRFLGLVAAVMAFPSTLLGKMRPAKHRRLVGEVLFRQFDAWNASCAPQPYSDKVLRLEDSFCGVGSWFHPLEVVDGVRCMARYCESGTDEKGILIDYIRLERPVGHGGSWPRLVFDYDTRRAHFAPSSSGFRFDWIGTLEPGRCDG